MEALPGNLQDFRHPCASSHLGPLLQVDVRLDTVGHLQRRQVVFLCDGESDAQLLNQQQKLFQYQAIEHHLFHVRISCVVKSQQRNAEDGCLFQHGRGGRRRPGRLQPLHCGSSCGRSCRKLDKQLRSRRESLSEVPADFPTSLLSRWLREAGILLLLLHRRCSRGTHEQGIGSWGC
ncbi:unnamed protein product [Lampetra planeri]